MKNIFNPDDNLELIHRLENLNIQSERQWGKMDVAQMVVHCQKPLEVADQKLMVKRNLISFLFGSMMKKKLIIKGEPFKQNLPTAKEFKIESLENFDIEKAKLMTMISDLGKKGPSAIAVTTHPFFGDMTPDQWGLLFYKHLDHHLKQFGV